MALIVEDGTGKADAESYISVSDASAYHSARGNTTWATMSSTEMEQAIRRATDYMQQAYRGRWQGFRVTTTQALDWPRQWVPFSDAGSLVYYANNEIPKEVKNACAELAWKAAAGELAPDIEPRVISESVGPISTQYADFGKQSTEYRAIDNLLAQLLNSGGTFRRIERA